MSDPPHDLSDMEVINLSDYTPQSHFSPKAHSIKTEPAPKVTDLEDLESPTKFTMESPMKTELEISGDTTNPEIHISASRPSIEAYDSHATSTNSQPKHEGVETASGPAHVFSGGTTDAITMKRSRAQSEGTEPKANSSGSEEKIDGEEEDHELDEGKAEAERARDMPCKRARKWKPSLTFAQATGLGSSVANT